MRIKVVYHYQLFHIIGVRVKLIGSPFISSFLVSKLIWGKLMLLWSQLWLIHNLPYGILSTIETVSYANIFIIRRIKMSFCFGSDSATKNVSAASPVSLITGCPASENKRPLRCKKSINKKAPLRLFPSVKGWFLTTK